MEIINAGPRNIPLLNDNLMQRKSVVFFVAPWCGHCQRLEPTIDNLMGRFKNSKYPGLIARVQENEIPKVKCDNDIAGFPTIRVLKPGGKKDHDYEGPRDEDALKDFLKKIFEENDKMATKRLPFNVAKKPSGNMTEGDAKRLALRRKLSEERQKNMELQSILDKIQPTGKGKKKGRKRKKGSKSSKKGSKSSKKGRKKGRKKSSKLIKKGGKKSRKRSRKGRKTKKKKKQ